MVAVGGGEVCEMNKNRKTTVAAGGGGIGEGRGSKTGDRLSSQLPTRNLGKSPRVELSSGSGDGKKPMHG